MIYPHSERYAKRSMTTFRPEHDDRVMLHNLLFDRQIKLDAFILARRAQRHDKWSFGNRPLGSNT
jgi:hypothetical protein